MSFWNTVKRGFGYGLGGRLGWELGGWIWSLIVRAVTWLAMAVGAMMFAAGWPIGCSGETQQVQKPAAKQVSAKPVPKSP
jgi:hypothetical protein